MSIKLKSIGNISFIDDFRPVKMQYIALQFSLKLIYIENIIEKRIFPLTEFKIDFVINFNWNENNSLLSTAVNRMCEEFN